MKLLKNVLIIFIITYVLFGILSPRYECVLPESKVGCHITISAGYIQFPESFFPTIAITLLYFLVLYETTAIRGSRLKSLLGYVLIWIVVNAVYLLFKLVMIWIGK